MLVRADSAIRSSIASCEGRRVAIGLQGSASRTTALRVLEAHGLGLKDFKPLELPLGDALVALRQKEVDAVIQVIGVPADSVRDALGRDSAAPAAALGARGRRARRGEGRLLRLHDPRGTYRRQKQDVRTVATAALLLAGADLSETEVATITRLVFEKGRDFAARGSAQGAQVSAATARQGLSVPLHTAAVRVLEELAKP